jgi:single-strand DNA-binding protein
MNKVILMGRLTRDPEVRYSQGDNATAIARFTLAVDRRIKRDNEASVDYINCVSFGRSAEFAEKYFHKGTKIVIVGRIQTGSYTNKDGQKVYTTDIVIEEQDFAESKAASQQNNSGNAQNASNNQQAQQPKPQTSPDGFMSADDEGLPFH